MHIVFEKIRFKNFLSSGNTPTEIELNKFSQVLITGNNGCGKSTLIEALSFVLFNRPYRDINKPQLINTINQRDMLVELWFTINDIPYYIKRGMKPNIFEIYKNQELLNQEADARDYQSFFEENIIKMKYKSFTQTVVMGTASFTPFMQLTTGLRRTVVEDLLDLQIFSDMNVILKQKQNLVRDEISTLNNEINLVQQKINLHEFYIKQINVDKKEQIDGILSKLEEAVVSLNESKLEKSKLEKIIETNKNKVSEIDKVRDNIDDTNVTISKLEYKLSQLKKENDFFTHTDNCPTCKQEISEDFKNEKLHSNALLITELNDGIKKLNKILENNNKKYTKLLKIKDGLNSIKMDINTHTNNIKNYEKNIKEYNEQIEMLEMSNNTYSIQEDSNTLQEILIELNAKLQKENEEKSILEAAAILLKDTGIKGQIIKTYIPIINKYVNEFLDTLGLYVNFELDENFNESLKSRHRDIFSYGSFSEGEKLRLNLALIFTWRAISKIRCSTTTNIIFFDEILDSSLDYDGIDGFFKLINQLQSECNVFVISHKDSMIDKFSNILRVEKKRGFSEWS